MKKAKPERETNEIMRHRRVFSWFCVVAFRGCGMDHCLWSFTSCLLLSLYISFPPFYSHNTPNCICFPITRPVTVWIALEKKMDAVFLLCLALFFSASNRCWLFFWCTRPNLFELDAIGTFESQECFSLLLLLGWLFAPVWRWLLNNGGDSAEANGVKYYPDTLSHDVELTLTVRSIYHASDAAIHHRMWSNCLIWMCLSAYLPFPFQSTEMAFIRHILPSTLLLSHQAKSHFDSFPTLLHRINESIIQFYLMKKNAIT